jgi:putative endonuclease
MPTPKPNQAAGLTGADAEQLVCRHLEKRKLKLVQQNFRAKCGEIDLIMRDGQELVFIEVKYRRSSAFGSAAEAVTPTKQLRLARAAALYLQRNHQNRPPACRFDVVTVCGSEADAQFDWIRNAFQPLNA